MKTAVLIAGLGAMFALATPAFAGHRSATPDGSTTESSLDIDLELGPRSFRLGGRLFGRQGYAGGAWLNGEARRDGFSVDGRVEHNGKAHNFKFNADLDEWARRAIRWPGATDL
jgi:hypothetical protein